MTRPITVLIVDDERPLVDLLASYFERESYRVLRAYDGRAALELAQRESPDLVVLDLMLPEIDGLEVCRELRRFSDAYVVMLTARSEEVDRIVGLSVGADDYVVKPFSPREVVARAHAMLRRPRSIGPRAATAGAAPIRIGDLVIDETAHEVSRDGELIALTPIEFALLAALARHPGMVLSRDQLRDQVWGSDVYGDEHAVDVHVSNLRRKVERDPSRPDLIRTVRGVGYRLHRSAK